MNNTDEVAKLERAIKEETDLSDLTEGGPAVRALVCLMAIIQPSALVVTSMLVEIRNELHAIKAQGLPGTVELKAEIAPDDPRIRERAAWLVEVLDATESLESAAVTMRTMASRIGRGILSTDDEPTTDATIEAMHAAVQAIDEIVKLIREPEVKA